MEENKENDETKEIECKVVDETKKVLEQIIKEDAFLENLDTVGKLTDIYKDINNIWKENDNMRYGAYSESYGRRGVPGTGRGRYRDSGNVGYGRRGVPGTGRYRGEDIMDEMMEHYGNYSEGKEMYGSDPETMKSFKYMLKAFKDYYKHLKQEASSQEEVEMLEDTAREMMEM